VVFEMIISDTELNAALTEVDAKLRQQNIDIPARPLCALSELSVKWSSPIHVPGGLSDRIFGWFDSRYGDRLKMGLYLGSTAVLIGGDAFKVRLPLIFGTIGYVLDCGPDERDSFASGRHVKLTNISKLVDGLTSALVTTMPMEERNGLVSWFGSAMVAGSDIGSAGTPPLISEAKGDLAASVDHLFSRPTQFGLSRWASLQAVEKLFKAFIHERGGKIARIHVLDDLAKDAEALGLAAVDRKVITRVQCSAGVRYGSETSTLSQAFEAHCAAMNICGSITSQLSNRNEWRIERYDCTSRQDNSQMVLLMRGTTTEFERARSHPKVEG
jgi:hypothetical protein